MAEGLWSAKQRLSQSEHPSLPSLVFPARSISHASPRFIRLGGALAHFGRGLPSSALKKIIYPPGEGLRIPSKQTPSHSGGMKPLQRKQFT